LSVVLGGCSGGSYIILSGDIYATDNTIIGEYSSFDGTYFKKVKFKKDQVVGFDFAFKTVNGEISARVIDSLDKTIIELSGKKTLAITETDNYKIQVEGKDHQGIFAVAWNITSE